MTSPSSPTISTVIKFVLPFIAVLSVQSPKCSAALHHVVKEHINVSSAVLKEYFGGISENPLEYNVKHKKLLNFLYAIAHTKEQEKLQEFGPRTKSININGSCYKEDTIKTGPMFNHMILHKKLLVDFHIAYLQYEIEKVEGKKEREPKPNETTAMQLERKLQSLCANLKQAYTSVPIRVEMPINYPVYNVPKGKPIPDEPIPFDDEHKPEMRLIAYEIARIQELKAEGDRTESELLGEKNEKHGHEHNNETDAGTSKKQGFGTNFKAHLRRVTAEVLNAVPLNTVRNELRALAEMEANFIYELKDVAEEHK